MTNVHTSIAGYLMDTTGIVHDLLQSVVTTLEAAGVKPDAHHEEGKRSLPLWRVDEGGDRYFKKGTLKVNDCVYRAIRKYVESLGMGTLTEGDMEFFETHPRVNGSGVGQANVLCVAHGLLVPWGLGITHIYMPKMSALGDQHSEFAKALGMNIQAIATNAVSNEEFIEFLELDPYGKQARLINKTCNFEFVDTPPGPCVVMLSNYTGGTKKSGGANTSGKWSTNSAGVMGHADFIGPRDRLYGDWRIAFRIGKLPEYADNGINKYAELDAFGAEELAAKADSMMSFSTWQSVIGGKNALEWQKAVAASKPKNLQVGKQEGGKGKGTTKSPKQNGGTQAIQTLIAEPCPICQGQAAKIDSYKYCLSCEWWQDDLEGICPFCYADLSENKCAAACGYDSAEWLESTKFACANHHVPLYFRRRDESYCFVCPECLFTKKQSLYRYFDEYTEHPAYIDIGNTPDGEQAVAIINHGKEPSNEQHSSEGVEA